MIELLPVMVLLVGAGILTTTTLLIAAAPLWRGRLMRFEPARRCRWILTGLAFPPLAGLLLAVLSFGPCWSTLLRGAPDACRSHAEPDFYLCLLHPARAPTMAWMVAVLLCISAGVRAFRVGRRVGTARRAASVLQTQGTFDSTRRAWIVPGHVALVAGWPVGSVYLGRSLLDGFGARTVEAVLAHEHAHVQRRDLQRKLLGRLLALFHAPLLGRLLLGELDLAIEQACDAAAAQVIGDPLEVAQAIVEMARLPGLEMTLAFSETQHIEARVEALCGSSSWVTPSGEAAWATGLAVASLVLAVAGDRHLHELAELLFERLVS